MKRISFFIACLIAMLTLCSCSDIADVLLPPSTTLMPTAKPSPTAVTATAAPRPTSVPQPTEPDNTPTPSLVQLGRTNFEDFAYKLLSAPVGDGAGELGYEGSANSTTPIWYCTDNKHVFVMDRVNNRIAEFDDGNFVKNHTELHYNNLEYLCLHEGVLVGISANTGGYIVMDINTGKTTKHAIEPNPRTDMVMYSICGVYSKYGKVHILAEINGAMLSYAFDIETGVIDDNATMLCKYLSDDSNDYLFEVYPSQKRKRIRIAYNSQTHAQYLGMGGADRHYVAVYNGTEGGDPSKMSIDIQVYDSPDGVKDMDELILCETMRIPPEVAQNIKRIYMIGSELFMVTCDGVTVELYRAVIGG